MDLFIDPTVEFTKTAAEVDLPEDPATWPKEVLDELYKQVPYIADFQPHVVMQRVDAERRYGLGHVEISNQSEAPMNTDPNMLAAAGVRTVRVPVVIRNGKLCPFDLLVNDGAKVLPLTEARLRQAIFRPQQFDVTSQTPGDSSLIGQLYPPYRQNYGFGGGGISMPADGMKVASARSFEEMLIEDLEKKDAGFRKLPEKTASAKPCVEFKKTSSILGEILNTINKSDLDQFWGTLEKDATLRASFTRNARATTHALQKLATCEPFEVSKLASLADAYVKPTVVQIRAENGHYIVKAASHLYWKPVETVVNRGELVRRFGEKVALAADEAGGATLSEGGAESPLETPTEEAPMVTEPGLYKVLTEDGQEIVGFVVPNLLDTDGEPLPIALFTNGSQATVQSEIHGEPMAEAANLPTGEPNGTGVFFTTTPEGLVCTIPMILSGSYSSEGEPRTWSGETYDGRPLEVSQQPNIQQPMGTEEGKMLIPLDWQWSPMDLSSSVALKGSEENFGDSEMPLEEKEAMVVIRGSNGAFTFEGTPVAKLAHDQRVGIDVDQATFLLAGLGVELGHGVTKLAHATLGDKPERVKVSRQLRMADEVRHDAVQRARTKLASMPNLKRNLLKEASALSDPMAVDTVLSLGFLNPENLMTFVSYLPSLDDTQLKLCELLLATRLGLNTLSETALERSVRSMEEAIEGLKVIAFSE